MRNMLAAFLGLASLTAVAVAPAPAQAQLNIQVNTNEPITSLSPDKWIYLMTHSVNASNVIGKDSVYMINATGEDIAVVTCGSYQLVGPSPYIKKNSSMGAPVALPKWTVTIVPTETFNTYCKAGVEGSSNAGSFKGVVNAVDKSFENSTFVYFKG